MRKINSPCYDGCALLLYVRLVSNVLQQTWPLLALGFTSPVFPDPTPFILFCLQPPQLPADEAFITAHLPQRKQFAKKDTEAHEPKVLRRTGWSCREMCSWSSPTQALTVLQPSPPAVWKQRDWFFSYGWELRHQLYDFCMVQKPGICSPSIPLACPVFRTPLVREGRRTTHTPYLATSHFNKK